MTARKPHKVEHVKFVRKGAVWYAYFNTGQKQDGKPVYRALPKWGSVGWWDSYASAKAGHTAWDQDTHFNAKKLTVWNFNGY